MKVNKTNSFMSKDDNGDAILDLALPEDMSFVHAAAHNLTKCSWTLAIPSLLSLLSSITPFLPGHFLIWIRLRGGEELTASAARLITLDTKFETLVHIPHTPNLGFKEEEEKYHLLYLDGMS